MKPWVQSSTPSTPGVGSPTGLQRAQQTHGLSNPFSAPSHGHPLPFREETKAFSRQGSQWAADLLHRGEVNSPLFYITTLKICLLCLTSPLRPLVAAYFCLKHCVFVFPLPTEHRLDQSQVFCLVSVFNHTQPFWIASWVHATPELLELNSSKLKSTEVSVWPGLAGHLRGTLEENHTCNSQSGSNNTTCPLQFTKSDKAQ